MQGGVVSYARRAGVEVFLPAVFPRASLAEALE